MPNGSSISGPNEPEIYLAGDKAPAGIYRRVDTNIKIHLSEENYLPASLDGHVAYYEPIHYTWHQLRKRSLI